ncbi:MAG: formyltransferase family protein [Pseudomonadota bacterium]
MTKPVVIICPMHKSMNTLVLMELCRRFDVPLAGVILRKLDFSRFRQEFSRDGTRLLRKVWRKFVLRADENAAESAVSLKSVFTALSPGFNDVRDFAKQLNVPVFEVTTLVEPPAGLASGAAHTALFTGGGLIRQAMLSHFPGGVINVHMGPLPQYKGMDVVQAPILDGCFTNVGLTAHLMAPGLDEGPVLSHFTTDAQAYPSLGSLRNEISALGPLMSFDAVLGLASGRYQTVAQPEAGRQYFITHEVLNAVISDVMAARYCEPDGPSEIEALVNRVLSSL